MRKVIFISLVLSCFLIQSCKNVYEKTISGWWSIDCIYYKKVDFRLCLSLNLIRFEKNNKISLPIIECKEFKGGRDKVGDWKLINDSTSTFIIVESENDAFNGKYEITFFKDDDEKLLKMRLKSNQMDIWLSKGMFNFDQNIDLINQL